jgi:hypothetical protein
MMVNGPYADYFSKHDTRRYCESKNPYDMYVLVDMVDKGLLLHDYSKLRGSKRNHGGEKIGEVEGILLTLCPREHGKIRIIKSAVEHHDEGIPQSDPVVQLVYHLVNAADKAGDVGGVRGLMTVCEEDRFTKNERIDWPKFLEKIKPSLEIPCIKYNKTINVEALKRKWHSTTCAFEYALADEGIMNEVKKCAFGMIFKNINEFAREWETNDPNLLERNMIHSDSGIARRILDYKVSDILNKDLYLGMINAVNVVESHITDFGGENLKSRMKFDFEEDFFDLKIKELVSYERGYILRKICGEEGVMLGYTVGGIERVKQRLEGKKEPSFSEYNLDPYFDGHVELRFEPDDSMKRDISPVLLDMVKAYGIKPSGPMGED